MIMIMIMIIIILYAYMYRHSQTVIVKHISFNIPQTDTLL